MIKKKILFAGSIGGAIEFYDFVLYGACAPIFAPLFFPTKEAFFSLLGAYAVFGIGFFVRPLGAVLFGSIGDRYGRRTALYASLLLMAISTLSIGLLPGYQKIGIWAPIMMIFSRLLQGLSAGGEYSGALVFAIEHNAKKHAGFVGSFVAAGCMFGLVLGSLASLVCYLPGMPTWSWRLAFVLGFFVSFVGLYVRCKLEETPDFLESKKNTEKAISLWSAFRSAPKELISVIFLSGFNGIVLYVYFVFFAPFLSAQLGLSAAMSKLWICLGTLTIMFFLVLFGWLSDLFGRSRFILAGAVSIIVASFLLFLSLEEASFERVFLYQMLLMISFASYSGPLNTYIIELFKASARYRCAAVGYSLGMGIIGGSAPFIAKIFSISPNNSLFLSLYIGTSGVLAIVAFLALNRKKTIEIQNILDTVEVLS